MLLQRFRQPLKVEYKSQGDKNPVTEVDRTAEAYLRREIIARFPDHAVLGEEGAGKECPPAEFTWALDPLDGTTNFINGLPVFACSVGLLHRGEPVVGAVLIPWAGAPEGVVYHARKGGGAYAQGRRIQVATEPEPKPAGLAAVPAAFSRIISVGRPWHRRLGELRGLGSIAYELAMVADGTFQYALFARPHVWDVAAGVVLVQEAGGTVLMRRGRRWEPCGSFASDGGATLLRPDDLRRWRSPVLAGGTEVLTALAPHLRPRRRWLLRRWARRLRQGRRPPGQA